MNAKSLIDSLGEDMSNSQKIALFEHSINILVNEDMNNALNDFTDKYFKSLNSCFELINHNLFDSSEDVIDAMLLMNDFNYRATIKGLTKKYHSHFEQGNLSSAYIGDRCKNLEMKYNIYSSQELPDCLKMLDQVIPEYTINEYTNGRNLPTVVFEQNINEDWKLYLIYEQAYYYKDDENWIVASDESLLFCKDSQVYCFLNSKEEFNLSIDDIKDKNLIPKDDLDKPYVKIDKDTICYLTNIGKIITKTTGGKTLSDTSFQDVLGYALSASSRNYRVLLKPKSLFEGSGLFIDSIGYINNEASYVSLNYLLSESEIDRQSHSPIDIDVDLYVKYAIRVTSITNPDRYHPSSFILYSKDNPLLKNGLLFYSDAPRARTYILPSKVTDEMKKELGENDIDIQMSKSNYRHSFFETSKLSELFKGAIK